MKSFNEWVTWRGKSAQGLTEYALILMLVAMIVIIVLWIMGAPIANVFSNVIANL